MSDTKDTPVKRKRGRPRKSEITPVKRNKVGRPKGEHSAMIEMKQRFLARRDTESVINSIFRAAVDDDHKNQSAAWKLIVDRILPQGSFEKDKLGSKPMVNITISGVGDTASITDEPVNIIEGDVDELD